MSKRFKYDTTHQKSLETHSEWQQTVWNRLERPRHKMAPIKKNRKISLSAS
jgi:hypothetical protein